MSRPRASASSSSTAGGSRRTGPGNAVSLADTPVFDELWAEHPHTQLTAMGEAVGLPDGPDGQLRGRPPQPRRRRDRPAGPRAHRRGGRGRLAGRERGAAGGAARRAARAPDRARLRRRRALVRPPPEGADRAGRRVGRRRTSCPRLHRRPRHVAARRAPTTSPTVEGWCGEAGAGRVGSRDRPLLRDGPRQALGPHRRRPYDLLVHGKAEHHADTGEAAARAAYERDETDEFITADDGRRGGARSAPATP